MAVNDDFFAHNNRDNGLLRAMKVLFAIFLPAVLTTFWIIPFDTEPGALCAIYRSNEPDGPEISGVDETGAY